MLGRDGSVTPETPYSVISVCPVCGESCVLDRRTNKAAVKIKREFCPVPPAPHYLGPWLPDTAV